MSKLLKLNLGCGNKILPGYTNVDLNEDGNPDVVCDITNLSKFKDNTADEILTVHVIEHFYLWQLPDVLEEWKRVLKPGGELITECPNLLYACQQIVDNPYSAALPTAQMSMWPLYGSPFEPDILQGHHWLFTPETLYQFLTDQGFDSVHQEAAVYKLREPRDFRMVCNKPRG